jgi:hypothetical protein
MSPKTATSTSAAALFCALLLSACRPVGESQTPLPAATLDNTKPSVSTVAPRDGARGIPPDTTITVAFSEPIDSSTVSETSLVLSEGQEGPAVGGNVAVEGQSLIFTPGQPLQFGMEYSAVLNAGIRDIAGNALAQAHAWRFRIEERFASASGPTIQLPGFSGGSFFMGYAVLDVNDDGLDDLIYGGPKWINSLGGWVDEPAQLTVLLNAGKGRFSKREGVAFPSGAPALVHPRDAKVADFNGDGKDDMFFLGAGYDQDPWPGEENLLLIAEPDGSFRDASDQLGNRVSGFSHSCAVGDIDADGDVDLVVVDIFGRFDPPAIYVLTNDGTGQFASRTQTVSGASSMKWTASELVDLDNDGSLDLVLGADSSGENSVILWNDRQGRFGSAPTLLPSPDPYSIVVDILPLDLNRDGYQDLVFSATKENPFYEGQYLQALVNDTDGRFADATSSHFPSQDGRAKWAFRVEAGDLDLDGDMDLVTLYDLAGPGETHPIWLNDGSGVFSQINLPAVSASGTMVPIDVDADGDLDFLSLSVSAFGNPEQIQRWTVVLNQTR